jgi:hypothetical protein
MNLFDDAFQKLMKSRVRTLPSEMSFTELIECSKMSSRPGNSPEIVICSIDESVTHLSNLEKISFRN